MFGHRSIPDKPVFHVKGRGPKGHVDLDRVFEREALTARDELDFKQGVIASLMEAGVPAEERNKAMKQRGGKYHRRIPKPGGGYKYLYSEHDEEPTGREAERAFLVGRLRRVIDRAGPEGCHPTHPHLQSMVRRHGSQKIAELLHPDYEVKSGMICRKGLKVAAPGAGGAGGGSVGTEPGTRKVWGNRVVEKQRDGTWKVVSHVAGLEGERTPRGAARQAHKVEIPKDGKVPRNLTQEQAASMIEELKNKKKAT